MTLEKLSAHAASEFQKQYGRPPRWLVAAPGRVNVIGEHTDYNDGFVLPMAIERYTLMAADPVSNGQAAIEIRNTGDGIETAKIDLSAPVQPGAPKWANYPRGVIAGFLARGLKPRGLDVLLHSTVPLGGGLSSSAALEVCTATLMETAVGKKLIRSKRRCFARKPSTNTPACPVASWTSSSP